MGNKGGLYKNVKMSLKTADRIIFAAIVALVIVMVFTINNGGFAVDFDTNGGTAVESQKLMYGDKVQVEPPTRQGYEFTGWFLDDGCTVKWDVSVSEITESITLYAGWEEND